MAEAKKSNMWLVHLIVMLFFMFGFRYLPAPAPITSYGMAVLGIFLGMVYGWCVPNPTNIYPALLGLFALSTTSFGSAMNVLEGAFGNSTIGLLITGLFIMPPIMDSGLANYLFGKVLGSKFCQGKPWRVVFALQVGLMALCFLVNPLLVCILTFALYQRLFELAGYSKNDLFPAFMNMGMLLNMSLVTMHFPWTGMALIPMGTIQRVTGLIWPFTPYLLAVIPFIIIGCAGWFIVMRVFPGCDASKLATINVSELVGDTGNMTKQQKGALTFLLIFIITSMFVALYGSASGNVLQQFLNKVGVYGVNLVSVALLAVIPIDGKPLLNVSSAARQFPWDLVILLASALLVGGTLTSAEAGISAFLMAKCSPILIKFNGIAFYLAIAILMMLLTNLLNNAAVMVSVSAMVATMFMNGLIDETSMYIAACLIAVVGNMGILHPGSSAGSAMYFGQNGMNAKSAYTASITGCIYCTIMTILILVPLANIFYH